MGEMVPVWDPVAKKFKMVDQLTGQNPIELREKNGYRNEGEIALDVPGAILNTLGGIGVGAALGPIGMAVGGAAGLAKSYFDNQAKNDAKPLQQVQKPVVQAKTQAPLNPYTLGSESSQAILGQYDALKQANPYADQQAKENQRHSARDQINQAFAGADLATRTNMSGGTQGARDAALNAVAQNQRFAQAQMTNTLNNQWWQAKVDYDRQIDAKILEYKQEIQRLAAEWDQTMYLEEGRRADAQRQLALQARQLEANIRQLELANQQTESQRTSEGIKNGLLLADTILSKTVGEDYLKQGYKGLMNLGANKTAPTYQETPVAGGAAYTPSYLGSNRPSEMMY